MPAPLVSVLIPTHDRPEFLRAAITSVLDNGFDAFEIVVSDDTPAAAGRAVVEAFADPRVRFTHWQGTPGRIENSTNASRAASPAARYHFKLDDDDLILPGFLEKAVARLEGDPGLAAVFTGFTIRFLDSGRTRTVIDDSFFRSGRVSGRDYCRAVLANEGGFPQNQKTAGVYRRDVAERFGYYDGAPEDFVFSVAVAASGAVGYIPEALYVWNSHEGSSSTQDLFPMFARSARALRCLRALPQHPEVADGEWERLIATCEKVLPSFYLLATPTAQVPALWRRMAPQLSAPQRRGARVALATALTLPLTARDRLKILYARYGQSALARGFRALFFRAS